MIARAQRLERRKRIPFFFDFICLTCLQGLVNNNAKMNFQVLITLNLLLPQPVKHGPKGDYRHSGGRGGGRSSSSVRALFKAIMWLLLSSESPGLALTHSKRILHLRHTRAGHLTVMFAEKLGTHLGLTFAPMALYLQFCKEPVRFFLESNPVTLNLSATEDAPPVC